MNDNQKRIKHTYLTNKKNYMRLSNTVISNNKLNDKNTKIPYKSMYQMNGGGCQDHISDDDTTGTCGGKSYE